MSSSIAPAFRRALSSDGKPDRVAAVLDRLEGFSGLDPVIDRIRQKVRGLPLGPVRDVLHGRWLGHPVHPVLVQVPIGAWMSTAVLDLMPGERRASRTLVAVGLAAAAPAAWAGWIDWAELHKRQQRVGLVHATTNVVAIVLYAGSLSARLKSREALGRTLGFAGLAAVGISGTLGGHMAYRQAAGANHAEEVPHLVAPGWHPLGEVADFPVGEPVRRAIDDVAVLVVREVGGTVHALADHCSHLAGPLSQGKVADGCVQCPWHGSVFRLSDGWNVRGPATAPQPAFDTRIVDGRVEARLREKPPSSHVDGLVQERSA
ncbi:Rieske 2Fe-2S domain-containing protein [Wenjunlia tyrosinilytica]|jgi:nitrite reductase/ring-hydroxylating ferredoxin subunit/uncharacterized membrane protein|nr:Rieske 2Fe-2S domain-containing protein [Wenjunlia tyrosinilytica]